MHTSEIRHRFIEYYAEEGYLLLPRAPMLDDSIPMSFVMSAGLIQVEKSLSKVKARDIDKIVLVQDCFRHFDLDKIGKDNFHLSIFEMPGAFKFGPNGKMDTIQKMWHLATEVLGIDPNKLWASYFRGGKVLGNEIPEDTIVRCTWLDLGLPATQVIGLGYKDNFWLQGKGFNGGDVIRKSGPNSELFYDRGEEMACGTHCLPGCKCGRFIEFSNSLFINYEINPNDGKFEHLDDPYSETVIGTERVAMILQGGNSVFDIDSYRTILDTIQEFIRKEDVAASVLLESKHVIADHIKALYLLVADGAPPPGKNGRERIVKLLIRRVVAHQIILGITDSEFISTLLNFVAPVKLSKLSDDNTKQRVLDYFADEEPRFMKTIERGQKLLGQLLKMNQGTTLSGDQIVSLEKLHGLPRSLIVELLRERRLPFMEVDYVQALRFWKETAPKYSM